MTTLISAYAIYWFGWCITTITLLTTHEHEDQGVELQTAIAMTIAEIVLILCIGLAWPVLVDYAYVWVRERWARS